MIRFLMSKQIKQIMKKLQLEKITYSYIYPYHIKVDMYSVKVESHEYS
jgi:hypothetical protein